jgi:hypothetical protein
MWFIIAILFLSFSFSYVLEVRRCTLEVFSAVHAHCFSSAPPIVHLQHILSATWLSGKGADRSLLPAMCTVLTVIVQVALAH